MNRIASDFKMQLIRNSAIPLHERKAKPEKTELPTFEELIRNAIVSHVTGADLSDEAKEDVSKTDEVPHENKIHEVQAAKTINSSAELNTSLKWYDHSEAVNLCPIADQAELNRYMDSFIAETRARTNGMAKIRLGANELPKFMEELQKVAESGGCLTEFLQQFISEPVKDRTAVNWHNVKLPTQGVDVITLNPETGEVVHAQHFQPLGLRVLNGGGRLSLADRDALNDYVWDLAYDLHKFIQHAFFKQEDDCPNEIDKLLEEIKARQENKCMRRFDYVAPPRVSLNVISQTNINILSYEESNELYSHLLQMSG